MLVVILIQTVIPMRCCTIDGQWRLGQFGLIVPVRQVIREVGGFAFTVTIHTHLAVAMVSMNGADGCIDGDMVEVDT